MIKLCPLCGKDISASMIHKKWVKAMSSGRFEISKIRHKPRKVPHEKVYDLMIKGYSQNAIAKKLGVTRRAIGQITDRLK